MSAHRLVKSEATDLSGQWRAHRARVVNSETSTVLIKSTARLKVGERISFTRLSDMQSGTKPDLRSAVIWRIAKGCLHLTRT